MIQLYFKDGYYRNPGSTSKFNHFTIATLAALLPQQPLNEHVVDATVRLTAPDNGCATVITSTDSLHNMLENSDKDSWLDNSDKNFFDFHEQLKRGGVGAPEQEQETVCFV